MVELIEAAPEQVTSQASCLFSAEKYSEQKEVTLIAASGKWWSFSQAQRPSTTKSKPSKKFQLEEYVSRAVKWDEVNNDDDDDDDEWIPIPFAELRALPKKERSW